MARSLDDLIRFLLDEIALCGQEGVFICWACYRTCIIIMFGCALLIASFLGPLLPYSR